MDAAAKPKQSTSDNAEQPEQLEPTKEPSGERSAVVAIGKLLRDGLSDDTGDGESDEGAERPDDGDEEPGAPAGDSDKGKPKTLAQVAEALKVKVEDLYAIEFRDGKDGTGETRTLGQLKDLLAEDTDLSARELQFEERRVATENELLRARQDLSWIVSQLPKSAITPAIREKAVAERSRIEKVERAKLLDAIPEWSDKAIEESERDAISDFIGGYGFGPGELDRIIDHRMLKLLRDNWQRSERVRKAIERVEKEKPKPTGNASRPGQPRKQEPPRDSSAAKRSASKTQVAAIGKLLREGIK